jgi:DnaJ-class molecular chaperone
VRALSARETTVQDFNRKTMSEKLPHPCEHCGATGIFHGIECGECGGKGHRLVVDGRTAPIRQVRTVRPPRRTFQRDKG